MDTGDTGARTRWYRGLGPESGPRVARWFHSALGIVFALAFLSLLRQVGVLHYEGGLAPIAEFAEHLRGRPDASVWDNPTLWWWGASDGLLWWGAAAGLVCGVLAALGLWARPLLGAATVLYMSYVNIGLPFMHFQWDNLLLECGVLAVLLPRHRPARLVHLLLLALWFKLYFESGVAKWGSPLGDWQDGSAMTFYYETAPIPTALGWYAHNLPAWWHGFESRAMLVVELAVPLLAFLWRPCKLVALVVLTGFMLINLATANYGFFVYLSLALHLFLLRDRDLEVFAARVSALARRVLRRPAPGDPPAAPRGEPAPSPSGPLARAAVMVFAAVWFVSSAVDGVASLARRSAAGKRARSLAQTLQPLYATFHVAHTYHLFTQITRARIEPEFQVLPAGETYTPDAEFHALTMHYKPGPTDRAPPLVAPHQPRVDFQLWFYGLAMRRPPPAYVQRILRDLCTDQARIQPLFETPIQTAAPPVAVRLQFWRYTFTTPAQREATGDYWNREFVATSRPLLCRMVRARDPGR